MTHLSAGDAAVLAVAFLVGTVAVARATRLVTADAYPPVVALRVWWLNRTEAHPGSWRAGWGPLATCPFCFAPYAAAVDLGWAWWSGLNLHGTTGWGTGWWLVNVWATVSYLAAMIVARDEPPAED